MMTVLYIFLGLIHPLNKWHKMCIERSKEIYPNADFQIITCLDEFEYPWFKLVDAYEIKKELEANGYPVDLDNHCSFSDYARFNWLSKYANTLYVDVDTWCTRKMPLTEKAGNVSIEAMWNGYDLDLIKRVFAKSEGMNLLYHLGQDLHKEGSVCLTDYFEHKPKWGKKYRRPDLVGV